MRGRVVSLLAQRLQIEDWFRRHPEIGDEPIESPLIGLGLPRTGSTALSFLLAEDPGTRSLRMWESAAPAPPPSTVEAPDPRIAMAEMQVAQQRMFSPRSAALVPSTATGPMECQELMALDFKSQIFLAYAYLPSYSDWFLYDADLTSDVRVRAAGAAAAAVGRAARSRGGSSARRTCCSSTTSTGSFPDARFVMTHRDPADVIVSVADVYLEIGGMFSEEIDLHYLGALNLEHWSVGDGTGARRSATAATTTGSTTSTSAPCRPTRSVRSPSCTRGWASRSRPSSRPGWRTWWQEFAANREQNVHPDPATFGLVLDDVRPRFAEYTKRMAQWTAH